MPKLYRSNVPRRMATCFFVLFALIGVCDVAAGFSPSHSKPALQLARRANEWQLSASTAPLDKDAGLSYGERSRPFRRDLFSYDDWVDHRRSDRFGGSLFSVFRSGVFQQLLKEIYLTTGIATFVCLYNALLVTGYDDFVGVHHDPLVQGLYVLAIPGLFFTVTSPALSLLLGTSQQSNEKSLLKTFCSYTRCNFTM
jgi:ion channel-forming bestrophin family protein